MDKNEISKRILDLLDCPTERLVDSIYKLSQAIEFNLDYDKFTGYFDDTKYPICVGDYVVLDDGTVGTVTGDSDDGFFVEYHYVFNDIGKFYFLQDIAGKCHVVDDDYLNCYNS